MPENGQRLDPTSPAGESQALVLELSPNESELARGRLRQRWELASVLNFLNVFEPILGNKMKTSAEEIETALITPNSLLSQLHIILLKGIPPVNKNLNGSDAWVTVLCKKILMWWPWVAEGDVPLMVAKGEEISRYKELDPTIRLLLLKALCEIRAEQDDAVCFINDALKNGAEISSFRRDKIGEDGNGTTYWYDGNAVIGHRLYKEVQKLESKPKFKGKGSLPSIIYEWETLATNLEEFRKVVDRFSCSQAKLEVAVARSIETDAIPVLEKLHKKKGRALKRQQRQEMLLNDFQNSVITRSCRNRRPVSYTFDEYDRVIDEAIQLTRKRNSTEEPTLEEKQRGQKKRNEDASNGCLDAESDSWASDTLSGHDNDDVDDADFGKDDVEVIRSSSTEMENKEPCHGNHATISQKQAGNFALKQRLRSYSSLGGTANNSVSETRNLGAKNRLRQRPTRNSALESAIVPDSESDQSSNGMSSSEKSPSVDLGGDDDN
ncbi:DDT domain-containing protein DDR4 isoform X2 [Diospyros lotus]|uniref:DDT domain-containing protein DDR4 isoform X2 n=1 Tax=Diospyros lotus TaxID=55363 RepID=UPI002258B0E2|nr:DDT domain-containing protein DDR4 isoform X2 [Diospyros lotus]